MTRLTLLPALVLVLVAAGCGGDQHSAAEGSLLDVPAMPTGLSTGAGGAWNLDESADYSISPDEATYRYPTAGERWYRHEATAADDGWYAYYRCRNTTEEWPIDGRMIDVIVEEEALITPVGDDNWFAGSLSCEGRFVSDGVWWQLDGGYLRYRSVIATMPTVFTSGDRWSVEEVGAEPPLQVDVEVLGLQVRSPNGYDDCIRLRIVERIRSLIDPDVIDFEATYDRYLRSGIGMVYEEVAMNWSDGESGEWVTTLVEDPDITLVDDLPTTTGRQLPTGVSRLDDGSLRVDAVDTFRVEPDGANYQLPLDGVFWYHNTDIVEFDDGSETRRDRGFERYDYRVATEIVDGLELPCIAASVEIYHRDSDDEFTLAISEEVRFLASDGLWWHFTVDGGRLQSIEQHLPVHLQEGDSWSKPGPYWGSSTCMVMATDATAPEGTTDCFQITVFDGTGWHYGDASADEGYRSLFVKTGVGEITTTDYAFDAGGQQEVWSRRLTDPPTASVLASDG